MHSYSTMFFVHRINKTVYSTSDKLGCDDFGTRTRKLFLCDAKVFWAFQFHGTAQTIYWVCFDKVSYMCRSVECFFHVSFNNFSSQMLPVDNTMNMGDVTSNWFHSRNKAFYSSSHVCRYIQWNVDQIGQWNAFIIKILHYTGCP